MFDYRLLLTINFLSKKMKKNLTIPCNYAIVKPKKDGQKINLNPD